MKKTSYIFIIVMAVFLFSNNITSVKAATIDIGVAWWKTSTMADSVLAGFDEGIKELAPNIRLEKQINLASKDDFTKVLTRWEKEKQGMVLLRSAGAKWLAKNPPKIPAFIGGCNHPGYMGTVKNINAPEGKITGVTYYLPAETQIEIFQTIIPNLKSILLLVSEGHPSSPIDQERTRRVCDKFGIKYHESSISSLTEAIDAINSLEGKISAILLGNQTLTANEIVEDISKAYPRIPILAYSHSAVKMGALGGFAPDDVKMGYLLAESVVDVLVKGKAIRDVPIKTDPKPTLFLNAKTAQRLGLQIPYEILEASKIIE